MSAPRSYFAILFTVIVGLITLAAGNVPAQIDIWVDPGHGGWDSGAEGFNGPAVPNEKELNIGVASRLENRLTALGYYAYRTQNYDTTYTQPWQRRQIANGQRSNDQGIRSSCRLLISVHMNSVPDASKLGTLTLYAAGACVCSTSKWMAITRSTLGVFSCTTRRTRTSPRPPDRKEH